jgi:hypothetical protein
MNRAIGLLAILVGGCSGGGGGTESLSVNVTYAARADATLVAAVHAYVVTGTAGHDASCNLLIAGAQEPFDVDLRLLGEGGARAGDPLTASVTHTEGVCYVVAFDYAGVALYAGCSPVAGSSVSVALGVMAVYDCHDPATPPGARCDDGDVCTVGEHCLAGQCGQGSPRDCSALGSQCSAGLCTPGVGCTKMAINEGLACDDGLYCTASSTCAGGACVGTQITCPSPPGQCLQAGVCMESLLGRCVYLPKRYGTACDDGNPCMTGDYCDYAGVCQPGTTPIGAATTVECDGNPCTIGDSCSAAGVCTSGTTFAPNTTPCDDRNPCTLNDTCAGTTGACIPGTSFAASGTACWDTNPCTLGDQCLGSSTCFGGTTINDFDGDGYRRAANGTGTSYCGGIAPADADDNDRSSH